MNTNKKLFLSIVSSEFLSYRELLTGDLKRPNLDVAVQEDFAVTGGSTLEKLDTYIRHCDAVVHLIGKATGSIPEEHAVAALLASYPDFAKRLPPLDEALARPHPGFSYTQWEAYLALYHRRPLFIYRPCDFDLDVPEAPRDSRFVLDPAQVQAQREHYKRIAALGHDRGEFLNQERLSSAMLRDLVEILPRLESAVRVNVSPTRLRHTAERLIGRDEDLTLLDNAWNDEHKNVVVVRAFGGIGKTSLVATWMAEMAFKNWRGATRIFDWSFYSQRTRDQGGASSDAFIDAALREFGDSDPTLGSAWDRGARLAHLVGKSRCLLVLDGLEPLQHPPGPMEGKLKDQALEALLKGLVAHNDGLCIVTTREKVNDIKQHYGRSADDIELARLTDLAGAALLHYAGATHAGAKAIPPTDAELQTASREVRGHPLTLQLLGQYLRLAEQGDIRRRDTVEIAKADAAIGGGHAFRLLAAYERHLSEPFAKAVREDIKSKRPSVFLSHASEDKESFARPLAIALKKRGLDVWYDEFALKLGDSIRGRIDRALADCDFAVAILSEHFFRKPWPQQEVSGLTAREVSEKRKIILPIWHEVGLDRVTHYSPLLADRLAVSSSKGVDVVAEDILAAISPQFHPAARVQRSAELLLLRLFGLFDGPISYELLRVILEAPEIPDLTEGLVDLPLVRISRLIHQLEEYGLIYPSSRLQDGEVVVDLHPLVREYFSIRLKEECLSSFEEAHGRLFEHFKEKAIHSPTSSEELTPLYRAVIHGCLAGRHQEAKEVYVDRILRGVGPSGNYDATVLGAVGANLGVLAYFFENPWLQPVSAFSEEDQAWLLNESAWLLRAVGRVTEALEPMRMALEIRRRRVEWVASAASASNLSELELTLGEVAGAERDASHALTYADRSGDAFRRMHSRARYADALHQADRQDEAETLFREAEQMQKEMQPGYALLYSLRGFHYCDLLLAAPERGGWRMWNESGAGSQESELIEACRAVSQRAAQTLAWAMQKRPGSLLDIALNHLTLGRAALYWAILESRSSHLPTAISELNAAVDGLRRAGQQDYLPRGLLTRAWLRCLEGKFIGPGSAQGDLDEAWEIAERGPMKLFLADIHLYRARLFGAGISRQGSGETYPWESPETDLEAAAKLIESCGYWRRKEELADARLATLGSDSV